MNVFQRNLNPARGCFRVMTYNVHRCRGLDRIWSPERIAQVIASCEPDIVALQELDVGRARSGHIDQAEVIARHLGMELHFFPTLQVMEERYGDAILSRFPARIVKAGPLPGINLRGLEPRGALWSSICIGSQNVQVINTHLSFFWREQAMQINELLGPEWLGHPDCREPLVMMGDINATTYSRAYRRLTAMLRDAHTAMPERDSQQSRATFPTRYPALRLDYIFVGQSVEVLGARTIRTPLARIASDHLPVVADLQIPARARVETQQSVSAPGN